MVAEAVRAAQPDRIARLGSVRERLDLACSIVRTTDGRSAVPHAHDGQSHAADGQCWAMTRVALYLAGCTPGIHEPSTLS